MNLAYKIGREIILYKVLKILTICMLATMLGCIGTVKYQENRFSLLDCDDAELGIVQPYEDKVVLAQPGSVSSGPYYWYINDLPVEGGISQTTFLADFNMGLSSTDEEQPISQSAAILQTAKFGRGSLGKIDYAAPDNLDLNEGSMEMWIILKQPLTSDVFDDSRYLFYQLNNDTTSSFAIRVDTEVNEHVSGNIVFSVYEGCGSWSECAVQLSGGYHKISVDEPLYLAATWSKDKNISDFFINGFHASRDRYDFELIPTESFTVGNNNIIVDEFRLSNRALNHVEVRDNYVRGKPFSQNDIYLSEDIKEGDEVGLMVQGMDSCFKKAAIVKPAKITVSHPNGFALPNASEINFTFHTESEMQCAFGEEPDLFNSLPNVEADRFTDHSISRAVDSQQRLDSQNFYVKCKDFQETGDDFALYRKIRVLPKVRTTYPKIANLFWGNTVAPDEIASLARYDMIGVSKHNLSKPSFMKRIRELNNNIIIVPYHNIIENNLKWPNAWANYDFDHYLSDEWRLMDNEGNFIIDLGFEDNNLYNLYTEVPYIDASVKHFNHDIFATGLYDGIWLDNAGSGFYFLRDWDNGAVFTQYPDIDLDGINEDLNDSTTRSYYEQVWADGIHRMLTLMRDNGADDLLIVGNNAKNHYPSDFNGKLWEEFFAPNKFDEFMSDDPGTWSFSFWQENTKDPHLNWNLFENGYGEWEEFHYSYMRYGLAASLMGGVFFEPTSDRISNRTLLWYDEYCVDISDATPKHDISELDDCRGYLGEPLLGSAGEPYLISDGVWRRNFENGIVILNPAPFAINDFQLGEVFRYIDGIQDTAANPGDTTSDHQLNLKPYDGRILLYP